MPKNPKSKVENITVINTHTIIGCNIKDSISFAQESKYGLVYSKSTIGINIGDITDSIAIDIEHTINEYII